MNNIARGRLENQHLVSPTLTEAADVVRAVGAVQSQDCAMGRVGVKVWGFYSSDDDRTTRWIA